MVPEKVFFKAFVANGLESNGVSKSGNNYFFVYDLEDSGIETG